MKASEIRDYLAAIGKKGGQAKGASKKRGSWVYYRQLAAKSAAARRAKAQAARES
jgi:hypothetical protein